MLSTIKPLTGVTILELGNSLSEQLTGTFYYVSGLAAVAAGITLA